MFEKGLGACALASLIRPGSRNRTKNKKRVLSTWESNVAQSGGKCFSLIPRIPASLSVTYGLNCIYENTETRNYFYLRARACLYTFLFLVAIMLSLVLSVFGNSISVVVYEHAPLISKAIHKIIHLRIYFTLPLLTFFWDLVYKYLPNRGAEGKTTLRKQLPGAFFTACGWMVLSFIFSVYLDIFKGFTNMYGSFTTIILVMLWLYGCMYIILLGGEINAILEGFRSRRS